MEVSRYCEICKNSNCKKQQPDMDDLKPTCYVEIEMVEYERDYVHKELCTIDAHGEVDDVVPCSWTCEQEECDTCVVTKVFNEYARLTRQINKG
ncbi:hypothetical protein [Clostridium sp. AF32-12BH]|uniref:hypothetical protein n=1 Tax=Clostridium sp. AF32-12BH TaxID=2292006 RepID=UPI000E535D66|nr:hypothetical protein [Clostridium sp. AF32-12BH]RHP46984.1 hypothetical protein DWZ40_08760 [Clostridium sp. AF32-12BH]